MAELTVQDITRSGLDPTLSAASSGGDTFAHDPSAFVEVDNASGSSVDVTFTSQYPSDPQGLSKSDLVVSVPDGGRRFIGPFSDRAFADSDGFVNVSYSSTTSVTVGAFKVR
jgi:hypothetical protein